MCRRVLKMALLDLSPIRLLYQASMACLDEAIVLHVASRVNCRHDCLRRVNVVLVEMSQRFFGLYLECQLLRRASMK